MHRIAIVGASLAGLEAAKALRHEGFTGEIVLIGREAEAPYDRPPLTKELLRGTFTAADIALDSRAAVDVTWRLGTPVTRLDAATRTLRVGSGPAERYDGIVIATGATPVRPRLHPPGTAEPAGVHVVRTLDDALSLAADLRARPGRVVVAGGGFIGAEVASTCRALRLDVTVVEGLGAPMAGALGPDVGRSLARLHRDSGVDLRLGTTVAGIRGGARVGAVELSDGTAVPADVVVLAVGVRPATGWLDGSGLTVDDGVLCDETCLAAPGIVAAGDVARWPNRRLGEVRRVEHWDNAIRQGRHAARRLLGVAGAYAPVPWLWSDQFGHKLQLLGSTRAYHEFRVVSGSLETPRFLGLYRRGDRVVAAVALGAAKPMLTARKLLDQNATWSEVLSAFAAADRAPALATRPGAAPPEGTPR
jgi:NADPH-dependent 2,4-dienoyl-CoA reductase/sulfur reductase-like enzyme